LPGNHLFGHPRSLRHAPHLADNAGQGKTNFPPGCERLPALGLPCAGWNARVTDPPAARIWWRGW
jgi:hypothetical protein